MFLFVGVAVSVVASTSQAAVMEASTSLRAVEEPHPRQTVPVLSQHTSEDSRGTAAAHTDSSDRAREWHVSPATGVHCKPCLPPGCMFLKQQSHLCLLCRTHTESSQSENVVHHLVMEQLYPPPSPPSINCPPLLMLDFCDVMQMDQWMCK